MIRAAFTVTALITWTTGCVAGSQPAASPPTFTCGLSQQDAGCVYTSASGRLRFVDSAARTLRAYVAAGATWQPLPRFYGNTLWSSCWLVEGRGGVPRTDHVLITDIDGDGRPDIVVAGYCITGIGPTGGKPFPVGTIYLQAAPGRYVADDARDSTFTDALPESCYSHACDVRTLARATIRRTRPSAPRTAP